MPGNSENGAGNVPSPENAWRKALSQFSNVPKESELLKAPFVQLFNLANDPHEDHNLAAKNPGRVARMISLLKKQIERGRSTHGPKLENDQYIKIIDTSGRRLPEFVRDTFR